MRNSQCEISSPTDGLPCTHSKTRSALPTAQPSLWYDAEKSWHDEERFWQGIGFAHPPPLSPEVLQTGLQAKPDHHRPGQLCDKIPGEQDQHWYSSALVIVLPSLLIFCLAESKVPAFWQCCQDPHSVPSKWAVRWSHYLTSYLWHSK